MFAPIILGVIAMVIGAVGRGRVKRGIADNGGVAIAGIVLGGLAIVVGVAFIAIWTTVWKDVRGGDYIDCIQKAGENQDRAAALCRSVSAQRSGPAERHVDAGIATLELFCSQSFSLTQRVSGKYFTRPSCTTLATGRRDLSKK